MKIVVAQLNNIVGDVQGNVDKVKQALSDKKAIESDLLVFSSIILLFRYTFNSCENKIII